MTTIHKPFLHNGHANGRPSKEEVQESIQLQRRFDDFKTLLFMMVVGCPLATVAGMLLGDWFMTGLSLFFTMSCGLACLYLLRRLETSVFRK